MEKILLLIIVGLIMTLGCIVKRDPVITIVNIGNCDRIELGQQLRIIRKYSPKIVALDFYLVMDSLYKDTILVKELEAIGNTVQVVSLHSRDSDDIWDSLKVSHPKFKIANHGFSNVTTEDSIIIKELPMRQTFQAKHIYAFSYIIAEYSFGVKGKFKNTGDKELKLNLDGIGENYKFIDADDLLAEKFRPQDLRDKIVLLGYIGNREDFFYLDRKKTKKINGVEVQAAIIDEIIDF